MINGTVSGLAITRTRSDQELSSDTEKKSSEQLGVLGISPGNINNLVDKFERQSSPLRADSKSPSRSFKSPSRDLKSPSRELKSPNLVQQVVDNKSPTRNTIKTFLTDDKPDDKQSTTSPESGIPDSSKCECFILRLTKSRDIFQFLKIC